MTRAKLITVAVALMWLGACSSDDSANESAGTGGNAGMMSAAGGSGGASGGTDGAGAGGASGTGASGSGISGASASGSGGASASGSGGMTMMESGGASGASGASGMDSGGAGGSDSPSYEEAVALIDGYASAHPGMDGDVNFKTPAELAADPEAQQIHDLCGDGAIPVIPKLAWEYGGSDHAWLSPEEAALVYCVYTPVSPDSDHWQYDEAEDHVTADVFVLYPEDSPCADEEGAEQVAACIGDDSNFEIIVDLASLNDGHDAGLELSEASTELRLVLPGGETVVLWQDI